MLRGEEGGKEGGLGIERKEEAVGIFYLTLRTAYGGAIVSKTPVLFDGVGSGSAGLKSIVRRSAAAPLFGGRGAARRFLEPSCWTAGVLSASVVDCIAVPWRRPPGLHDGLCDARISGDEWPPCCE